MSLACELAVQVRPELFEDIRSHVHADLDPELRCNTPNIPAARIVCGRNRGSRGVAKNFGEIELAAAGVGVSSEDFAKRIAQSRPPGANAAAKVARVLM